MNVLKRALEAACAVLAPLIPAAFAVDVYDRLADPEAARYAIAAQGVVTDDSHPLHPGDFRSHDVRGRVSVDPIPGEAAIELSAGRRTDAEPSRYFVRRGRIFQVNDDGEEVAIAPFGDLSPATVAALHPAIVASAILERRENLRPAAPGQFLFAWNDELWTVTIDLATGRIERLERAVYHERFGDGTEVVSYEAWPAEGDARTPGRVVVTLRGREVARLDLGNIERGVTMKIPEGDERRDRSHAVAEREIVLDEIAPHLFTIDLASINTRVTVAEFTDHVVVIEGAYGSRVCDLLATKVGERFRKPVRYFAFSHLHGQYAGGTRSWVARGATVLVPPSTAPLIEQMVAAPHTLHPDALSAHAAPLHVESIADRRRFEDATNALDIINVESGHTDEYFLFYFPRQKVLLTGDLLFYRPGKPLTGRSLKLCHTVAKLGLEVERCVCTWPLSGYDTKNVVSADEMKAACVDEP